jgi:hypothetical protein
MILLVVIMALSTTAVARTTLCSSGGDGDGGHAGQPYGGQLGQPMHFSGGGGAAASIPASRYDTLFSGGRHSTSNSAPPGLTVYTHLSSGFSYEHVASFDLVYDMALSCNSFNCSSTHGLNHSHMRPSPCAAGSSGHSANIRACNQEGQGFSAASFASIALAAVNEPGMMCLQHGRGEPTVHHGHAVSCSLLDELELGEQTNLLPCNTSLLQQLSPCSMHSMLLSIQCGTMYTLHADLLPCTAYNACCE